VQTLSNLATRFFGLLVLAVTVLALLFPSVFLPLMGGIRWILGLIMFGMGLTLTFDDFVRVARQPLPVIAGVCLQFLVMPLAGFAIAWVLRLPPELAVGVVLVGSCPGGTASNVIVYLARGDVALSVSMTAISTLLAPLLTPLLASWLAGKWMDVSAASLFVDIVKMVLLPVVGGVLLHRYAENTVRRVQPVLPLVSVVGIVLIIGAIIAASGSRLMDAGLPAFVAVVLHNITGLGLGWLAAKALRLGRDQQKAICIEVGMQNSGLAVALASAHLSPIAALPGAIFSVWHNISGSILVSVFGNKTPDA